MKNPRRLKYVDALDSLGIKRGNGAYELYETSLVRRTLKPGMTFVDCGAHIGYYTSMAAGIVGASGRVFAFEPDPTNFGLLALNVAAFDGNVKPYNVALSDAGGKARLYLANDNTGDHCMFDWGGRESVEVDTVTLDSIPELSCRSIDFIKIDVQGYETRVLRGARESLARSPNVVGIVEYAPRHIKLAGSNASEFCDELHSQGFKIYARSAKGLTETRVESLERLPAHINVFISRGKLA